MSSIRPFRLESQRRRSSVRPAAFLFAGRCAELLLCVLISAMPLHVLQPEATAQHIPVLLGPDGGYARQIEARGSTLYAAGGGGLARSSDSGLHWNTHVLPEPLDRFFASEENPTEVLAIGKSGVIYRSTDRGTLWNAIAQEGEVRPVHIDPEHPQDILGIANDVYESSLHRSVDGGATWTDVDPSDRSGTHTRAWVDPHDPHHLVASVACCGDVLAEFSMYASRDHAEGWTAGESIYPDWIDFHPARSLDVLAKTYDNRLMRSVDGGVTWEEVGSTPGETVAWSPHDASVLFAFEEDEIEHALLHVHKSTDLGSTWERMGMLEPALAPPPEAIAFGAPDELFIGAAPHAIWHTRNGGKTWKVANAGVRLTSVYDLAIGDGFMLVGVEGRGIMRSADDGSSWKESISNASSGGMHDRVRIAGDRAFSNVLPDSLYGTGGWAETGGLAVSGDDGQSWEYRPGLMRGPQSYGVSNDGSVIYGGARSGSKDGLIEAGLIKSSDAGRSWRELDVGTFDGTLNSVEDVQVDPRDPDRAYALVAVRGAVDEDRLLGTTDGGSTWEMLARHVDLFAISRHDPDVIYYATGRRPHSPRVPAIYRSDDSGRSWTRQGVLPDADGAFDLAVDPSRANRLFAATKSGTIQESVDGGRTWSRLAGPLASPWVELEVEEGAVGQLFGTTYTLGAQRLRLDSRRDTGSEILPTSGFVLKAYPNPSSDNVYLALQTAAHARVTLEVIDVLGRRIATLVRDRPVERGKHVFVWNRYDDFGRVQPSGTYVIVARNSSGGRSSVLQSIVR